MCREYLEHSQTLNLIKLAEHLIANGASTGDLGLALVMVDVMSVLSDRLPLSAQARLKEDLRGIVDLINAKGTMQ